MHTLSLLAALSNQITFIMTQQGDIYTVIPQVILSEPCVCQVQILSVRNGTGGQSHTQQKQTLSLPANQPIELSRLSVNISSEDSVKIILTVSNGQSLHLSQQWPSSAR
ncbi:curli assembly protein CsgC [Salmonella enterica]|uniref:Curli assembly protein n=1 Tax=Salmonella enterica TaxID=28901 RepID=A0A3J4MEB6_SALER|nr:curli assembly protein CsgC [Salmonella enterica]EGM9061216.1 curli assembly protein CsgC [Salmonella enterica]MFK68091.1 curli assembly protein CsgC [Salmonella enterica]